MKSNHYYTIHIKVIKVFVAAFLFMAAWSCERANSVPQIQRSVLIYMAADNNLYTDSYANIQLIKQSYIPANGNVLIYQDAVGAAPRLFRLEKQKNEVVEVLIEEYPEEDSADPAVLTRSLNRMRELFPAPDYGLILWSHGWGWLPYRDFTMYYDLYNYSTKYRSVSSMRMHSLSAPEDLGVRMLKSWAWDNTYKKDMTLSALSAAIPFHLSFIIFDACFMGGIEVAYALRNNTDYLVASPTEIMTSGFPYHQIIQPLFQTSPDLRAVCNNYYNYYNEEVAYGGTIALYKTEELQALANIVQSIYNTHRAELNSYVPSYTQIQCYDFLTTDIFFDLADFISKIATPSEYATFSAALSRVVIHKRATAQFRPSSSSVMPIDANRYSGISTYIPNGEQVTRDAYKNTDWNRAVRMIEE